MVGLVAGVTRMILDYVYVEPECGLPDDRPMLIAKVHYMYFALILFFLSGLTAIIVSLLTKPPELDQVNNK